MPFATRALAAARDPGGPDSLTGRRGAQLVGLTQPLTPLTQGCAP